MKQSTPLHFNNFFFIRLFRVWLIKLYCNSCFEWHSYRTSPPWSEDIPIAQLLRKGEIPLFNQGKIRDNVPKNHWKLCNQWNVGKTFAIVLMFFLSTFCSVLFVAIMDSMEAWFTNITQVDSSNKNPKVRSWQFLDSIKIWKYIHLRRGFVQLP